jgi:hypothetical protein
MVYRNILQSSKIINMTQQIKILAKCDSPYTPMYFWDKLDNRQIVGSSGGEEIACSRYISQEKVMEDGKEVPK